LLAGGPGFEPRL